MSIYIECLTLINFITKLFPSVIRARHTEDYPRTWLYIDASKAGLFAARLVGRVLKFKVSKLEFELRHIKDARGELVRMRITCVDLFNLQGDIVNSRTYQSLFIKEWNRVRLSAF